MKSPDGTEYSDREAKEEDQSNLNRRGFITMVSAAAIGCLSTAKWPKAAHAERKQTSGANDFSAKRNVGRSRVLSSSAVRFQALTGDYNVAFGPGMDFVSIGRKNAEGVQKEIALRPGGDLGLCILSSDNPHRVSCNEENDLVKAEIAGILEWGHYNITLLMPQATPGLIHSRIEIEATRDIEGSECLFAGKHPELAYVDRSLVGELIYYLNGTPGANTYHTVPQNPGAILDNNQWVYFGDPAILESTVFYFEDFTTLNPFFEVTGTRLRHTIIQPLGCLDSHRASSDGPISFGWSCPQLQNPIKRGTRLLMANSYIYLEPGTPDIHESVKYCGRFIECIASIYPYLKKPEIKILDWIEITEKGFDDLVACEKALHLEQAEGDPHAKRPIPDSTLRSPIVLESNLTSIQRYVSSFKSERGRRIVGDADARWRAMAVQQLPIGDAWQYLFPLVMAGDYAEEFDSHAAKLSCMRAADTVVEIGQRLHYVFPLQINSDFSKPTDVRCEYDCTGAYLYLMLLYNRFTGKPEYIAEARAAADRLLQMGFEFPYEFTTTSLAPVALLRLYKITDDKRYLDGIAIPMAAILRHSWFFNPEYGAYRGRTIFLLTEGMPGVYANGWEEASLIHYLNKLLLEGRDILPPPTIEMAAELLRRKGISLSDCLVPYLPDPSIIYQGIPRDWFLPINRNWNIPLEGFGYLGWDDSGMYSKPGSVGQAFYNFGALPEATVLLYHPLKHNVTLYVETPIVLTQDVKGEFSFRTYAARESFKAFLKVGCKGTARVTSHSKKPVDVPLKKAASDERLWFEVKSQTEYKIHLFDSIVGLGCPQRSIHG